MACSAKLTLRLPIHLKEGIERLARKTGRSQSCLCMQALQEYLEAQEWQVQTIRGAARKADSPDARFVPHDQVVAKMKRLAEKSGRTGR